MFFYGCINNLNMPIILRSATLNDLPLLKYWDKKPHVIFASGGDSDEEDDWMEEQLREPSDFVWIYIAELDKRPIGVIQIVDPANEETHYWGDGMDQGLRAMDIWIGEEDDLGKGYGTVMMKLALEKCFEDLHVAAILIDPLVINTRAIKFYQKMGFRFVENRYFGDDYCAVYRIDRSNWEKISS
jgi:aminoglycoside 6'-N-acetyltransferase